MDFKLSCVILALPLLASIAAAQVSQACVDEDVCMKGVSNYCKCQTGNGTMIDLSRIPELSIYKHKKGLTKPNEKVIFNACNPFSEGDCKDSVMCLEKTGLTVPFSKYYTLALPGDAMFSKCGDNYVLKYFHQEASRNMTTEVTLICDDSANKTTMNMTSEHEDAPWPQLPGDIKLEVRSKYVCPTAIKPTTHSSPTTTTVTTPHHNGTVTTPHHNGTVTTPRTTASTTPENSSVSMSSISAAVLIGITAIVQIL